MAQLMVGVSGVRGVFGDGLSYEIVERFAYAFGKMISGRKIVVGRDSRVSGPVLLEAILKGLHKAGKDTVDLGIASTPTTEMAVVKRKADGGIIITASHNPGEWNGLKFLGSDGVFIAPETGQQLVDIYESTGDISGLPLTGTSSAWDGADKFHVDSVLALDMIDVDLIASKKFTVAIDPVNGAGGPICTSILEELGCTVHGIHMETSGIFARVAEPLPGNLGGLADLVKTKHSDIGLAVDPDVDRLSLVDENGKAIGEELTLALAAEHLMANGAKSAACNLSTSRMIDDVAAKYGGKVHRSAVGEINVVLEMRSAGADFSGEGNGGIILSALHDGRDAVLGIALILQLLASRDETLSKIAGGIPSYTMIKEKQAITERGAWKAPVKQAFEGIEMDDRDGIKIILSDSWVHVRESNTEPVLRVIAEAPDQKSARALMDRVYDVVSG